MTSTFRVAFLRHIGGPLEFAEVLEPKLGAGQVLVKMSSIGICGSQVSEVNGKKGNAKFLPHLLGHEGVGTVAKKHESVSKVNIDDRVIIHWRKSSGLDCGPVALSTIEGDVLRGGSSTTFGEYALVSENRISAFPESSPDLLGVLMGCSLSTGLGAVESEAEIHLGASVLVCGLGPVGQACVLGSDIRGAGSVHALDPIGERRQLALNLGAESTFDSWKALADWSAANQGGFDYVFEASGNFELRSKISAFLAPRGKLVILGQSGPEMNVNLGSEASLFGQDGTKVIFSQGGSFAPAQDLDRWTQVLKKRDEAISYLAYQRFGPLESLNEMLFDFASGKISSKPVLTLN